VIVVEDDKYDRFENREQVMQHIEDLKNK